MKKIFTLSLIALTTLNNNIILGMLTTVKKLSTIKQINYCTEQNKPSQDVKNILEQVRHAQNRIRHGEYRIKELERRILDIENQNNKKTINTPLNEKPNSDLYNNHLYEEYLLLRHSAKNNNEDNQN